MTLKEKRDPWWYPYIGQAIAFCYFARLAAIASKKGKR
jgi:hypothetical protein